MKPGVYVLGGFGKSYLCSLLQKLRETERVDACTYPPLVPAGELLDSGKRDLVMLDRYDLYAGFGAEEMASFAERGIVLVDCKSHGFPLHARRCSVYLYEDRLVVR